MPTAKKGAKRVGKKGGAGVAALEALRKNGGSGGIGDDALFSERASGDEHHPDAPSSDLGPKKPTKMPGETDAFKQTLEMMGVEVGQLDAIVDYCSQRDLRNLPQLDQDLWDMGISNVNKRRRIINYWARSIGLSVDANLVQHYRQLDTTGQPEDAALPEKMRVQRRYFIEEDSAGNPKMRMARPGESAMSLKEANEAIRELRATHGKDQEAVILFSEQLGRHVPNSASEWVKNNMNAAWATAREYDRAMQQNAEPPDAMDVMIEQMGKVATFKEIMNPGGKEGESKSGLTETIDAFTKLDSLRGGRSSWMEDPIVFVNTIKSLNPEPKTDPAVEILRSQNASLLEKVGELQNKMTENQFAQLREQNASLAAAINDLKNRPAPGEPTAMTIMKDGVSKLSDELKGVRTDLKDLGKDLIMSPGGDAVGAVKRAVSQAGELEELTDELIDLTS